MVLVAVLTEVLTLGFTGLAFVTFDFEVLDVVALDFVAVFEVRDVLDFETFEDDETFLVFVACDNHCGCLCAG